MAKSPFAIDPFLTGIAIGYRNPEYIADTIAPYVTVGEELFEWDRWSIEELFTLPPTRVGRLSRPNEVTFSNTRIPDSTIDYALQSPLPKKDADNQTIRGYVTEGVMELVKLDREIRVASTIFNLNTYLSTNRATLSGTSQWSDSTSSPIRAITDALDVCLVRPNTMVIGHRAWTALRRHPEIVEAALGTSARAGQATREQVAAIFELDQVLVGSSHVNSAREGQTATYGRLWGNHCALIRINPLGQLRGVQSQITTMLTARFGNPIAGSFDDPQMGIEGGIYIRAGERVKEVLVSNLGGYYFQNAAA